jgi:hypothetical protein
MHSSGTGSVQMMKEKPGAKCGNWNIRERYKRKI